MDQIIEIKVNGNYLEKDSRFAGVQYEANARSLHITLDPSWDGYAKTVTFWNALNENPVNRLLTADLLDNLAEDTRTYTVPIPGEAMAEAGDMTFVIDGYDGEMFVGDRLFLTASFKIEGTDGYTLCLNDYLVPDEHTALVGSKLVIENAAYDIVAAGYKGDSEHTILTLDREFTHPEEGTKLFQPGGKRMRSVSDHLIVKEAPFDLNTREPMDPTPTQAEQLQKQVESILPEVAECASRAEAAADRADARADSALISETNAAQSAQAALDSENFANGFMQDAQFAAEDAEAAKVAAEKARDEAKSIAGGDYVTSKQLEDALSKIPTPDVSGQIAAHDTSETAHADIRKAIEDANSVLVVNFRAGEDDMVADKTLAEIAAFHNAGKTVVAHCPTLGAYGMPMTGINGSMAVFSHAFNNMGSYTTYTLVLMGDGTVDIMSDAYPTKEEMQAAIAAIPAPDISGQIGEHDASASAHSDIRAAVASKAPMYTYGTTDLEAGVTELETGKLHFVYE